MRYEISNIIFHINNSIFLNKYWELFEKIKNKKSFNFIVEYVNKRNIFNDVSICSIANNSILLKKESDLVLVNNEWNSIKIISINNIENLEAFLLQIFYTHAVRNRMILIHSSLIEYKNSGIMFLGPSGIGKTTQAELWHQYLDALIINGDCVFVEDMGDEFIGWGTPWHGSSPYCENTSVPVKALVVLKQGQENRIRKLEGFEKVSEVSNNIIYPMWIEDGMDLCLETLDHLLTHVPVYELVNKADEDSVLMVKQVMFDEKN